MAPGCTATRSCIARATGVSISLISAPAPSSRAASLSSATTMTNPGRLLTTSKPSRRSSAADFPSTRSWRCWANVADGSAAATIKAPNRVHRRHRAGGSCAPASARRTAGQHASAAAKVARAASVHARHETSRRSSSARWNDAAAAASASKAPRSGIVASSSAASRARRSAPARGTRVTASTLTALASSRRNNAASNACMRPRGSVVRMARRRAASRGANSVPCATSALARAEPNVRSPRVSSGSTQAWAASDSTNAAGPAVMQRESESPPLTASAISLPAIDQPSRRP